MTHVCQKLETRTNRGVALGITVVAAIGFLISGCGRLQSNESHLAGVSNQNIYRIGGSAIEAWGVAVSNTCSYYTTTTGDVDVTVRDASIVWGSRVFLVSGLTSAKPLMPSFARVWDAKEEVEMQSVSDFAWKARRSALLVERGRAIAYDSVSFVIKVVSPMGEERYIKPGTGDSYLNATFDLSAAECRRDGQQPAMKSMKLKAVRD
jgi:hypothetical protein